MLMTLERKQIEAARPADEPPMPSWWDDDDDDISDSNFDAAKQLGSAVKLT